MVSHHKVPQIMYARQVKQRKLPPAHHIKHIRRSNVVIHAALNADEATMRRDTLIGRCAQPAMQTTRMHMASTRETSSPFCHQRVTTPLGKILIFSTGNLIRAGKHTHSDAVLSILSFLQWVSGPNSRMQWPAAMSIPNTVLTGMYKTKIDEAVKNHWMAVYTSKFPGIALSPKSLPGITIELFLSQSKFIVPGVRSAEALSEIVRIMSKLHADAKELGEKKDTDAKLDLTKI